MSASAILSPVTVPLASQASGSSADASASAGEFATVLAAGSADTPMSDGQPGSEVAVNPPKASPPVEDDIAAKDALATSAEAVIVPLWIQMAPANVPGQTGEAGAQDDTMAAATASTGNVAQGLLDPDPATDAIQTLAAQLQTVRSVAQPSSGEATAPVQTSDTETTAASEKARVAAAAILLEGAAQRSSSSAGEAALASLRAMPGAEALQQATLTQRRIDPAANGSALAAVDDVEERAISGLTSGLAEPVVPDAEPKNGNGLASSERPALAQISPAMDGDSAVHAFAGSAIEDQPLMAEALPLASDGDGSALAGPGSTAVASSATFAALNTSSLSSLSRATIETTAQLAAQITQRLSGQSTRFELGLTPEGLGRVDVTLDIGSDGQLSARLAFDNPLAATELRGRADDLRRQLEDAGFTVARDALEFSSRDSSSGGDTDRRQQRATAYADRHAALSDPVETPPAWTLPSSSLTPRGVDVKV